MSMRIEDNFNGSGVTYYNDRWLKEGSLGGSPNSLRVKVVVDAVTGWNSLRNGSRVLDVGCGNGWILAALANLDSYELSLHGIEPSSVGVLNAQRLVPKAVIKEGTLDQINFDGPFDVIVCSEVIEHVLDKAAFVSALHSQLSDTGCLVMTTPNGRFRQSYFDVSGVTPQVIEDWCDKHDLRALLSGYFSRVKITSFDLSYWYALNPSFKHKIEMLAQIKGGWRLRRALEIIVESSGRGLYSLVTATR